jgi:peptide deformylase
MPSLKILTFPDKRLKQVAIEIQENSAELQNFIHDMLTTMYESHGIGLAATQVGSKFRLFVIDISATKNQPQCFINPKIIASDGQVQSEEGCLSFPDIFVSVPRKEKITVEYLDQNFSLQTITCEGLLSICIQHELEHLNGITFYDKLSPLKQERIRSKLFKQQAHHR